MSLPGTNTARYCVTIFGHDMEQMILFDIPFPDPSAQAFRANVVNSGKLVYKEVKHSGSWNCFSCGKPAHDVICNPMAWRAGESPRPLIMDIAFTICQDGGACRAVIDQENKEFGDQVGVQNISVPPVHGGTAGPAASTCAVCYKGGRMVTCSKCKTIRYCGQGCQKVDYHRHKPICAMVKKVMRPPETLDMTKIFEY